MMRERTVLFKTVHGSRLYNLAHADSDNDYFTLCTNAPKSRARYAKHKVQGQEDSLVMDFSTWLQSCEKGVPQALEAMFSTMPVVDSISAFRASYTVGTGVYETYFRTIKSFALQEGYKPKRHALRLALNLSEMAKTGRFNPTLSDEDAAYVSAMAHKGNEDVYGLAKCIAW